MMNSQLIQNEEQNNNQQEQGEIEIIEQVHQKNPESYRIAKEWRSLKIDFSNIIENVVTFEKESDQDPVYKIFKKLESTDNPECLTKGEKKISDSAKQFIPISKNELLYIDAEDRRLRILNINTGNLDEQFKPSIPTLKAMPEADRSAEKIGNLINDGMKIVYLEKQRMVVLLEEKFQYSNSQGNVVTCWKIDNQNNDHIWQIEFEETEQRNLEITALKDDKGTIIIWGPSYNEQPLKYRKIITTQVNGDIQENILIESQDPPLNLTFVSAWPEGPNTISFFGNLNNDGIPTKITVNTQDNKQYQQSLDVFSDEEDSDNKYWILNDVPYYNHEKQIAIIGRSAQGGEFLDIYNPITNKMTFQSEVNSDMGIIKRSFSNDNRFYIEYEENSHGDNDDGQPMLFQLTINTIVSVRTTICYFLEKSGVMDIYVPQLPNDNDKIVNENERPNLQNEQFLADVIAALTTGIQYE